MLQAHGPARRAQVPEETAEVLFVRPPHRPPLVPSGGIRHVGLSYPSDPRLVASLPGPPPRQASLASRQFAAPLPVAVVVSPEPSRRTTNRNAGLVASALVHFCAVIGLSLILGPLRLGRDEPLKLDLAVVPQEVLPVLAELDDALDNDLTAVRFDQAAALSHTFTPDSLQPLAGIPGGRGLSGQRGTFFGTVAYGNRFVYVLDVSSSMSRMRDPKYKLTRLKCAVEELLKSVEELAEDQYFYVVLFAYDTRLMFDEDTLLPQLIPATAENKERLRDWLTTVRPNGGTDPRLALQTALRMQPSAVFLLSDGEFNGQQQRNKASVLSGNPSEEEVIAVNNKIGAPVHTIAFEDRNNRRRMQAIAEQTGGEHRYIPPISSGVAK